MEEVLDQATWSRMKNETVLTSLQCKSGQLFVVSGTVEDDESYQEVLHREVGQEVGVESLLDEVEYTSSYEAVSHIDEKGVFLKMTYYLGDYAGAQNLKSSLSREEWSAMSDIRKVAAVDKLVCLSLIAKGLVE